MKFESSPRTYDANLHETDNPARVERLENLAQDEIFYILDHYDVDESVLAERYAALSAVDWKPGEGYNTIINNEIVPRNDVADGLTKAFTYDMNRQENQITPAIYYDDSLGQFELSHEMFHIMSTSVADFIIEETGDIYSKKGIKVLTYDSNRQPLTDNPYLICPQSSALNEGITELLAKRFQNLQGHSDAITSFDYRKNHQVATEYKQWTDLVDILSAPEHNQIVEAYFADNPFIPRSFMDDFNSRQSFIDSTALEYLDYPSSGMFAVESLPEGFIDERIVLASVEYATSFYQGNNSLDREWQRIVPIAERIIRQNIQFLQPSSEVANEYFERVSAALDDIYIEQQ